MNKLAEQKNTPTQLGLFSLVDSPSMASNVRFSNAIGDIDVIPRFKRGINRMALK